MYLDFWPEFKKQFNEDKHRAKISFCHLYRNLIGVAMVSSVVRNVCIW